MSSPVRPVRSVAGLAAALVLALALAACGSKDSGPDFGENDPELIVALGDSITFGLFDTGIDGCNESLRSRGGFCPRLEAMLGKTVLNRGICGADSYDGVSQVSMVLHRYQPGVLLIDYSPNDIINGTEALIANLRTMVFAAENNKTVPVLGTITPTAGEHRGWMEFIRAANPKILALCKEMKIECADHFSAFVNDPRFAASPYALLDGDGLHPNAAGYEVMAKTWLRPLKKLY